ncbi:Methyltransferase domain-containing protein [Prosthecobacter debontii]|uniref:Methyltransferase domain-containing protein n=1 Tax=Prosthecobacter debontii TaxID=48467 RepID=A0A1T4XUX6_9BACT|nr:class I SAM-dependent methyltransferase [Prosthecobacter debontii]SKA92841.1 Methyltransferase domain-containing protein [Prosthecobacter debontii]
MSESQTKEWNGHHGSVQASANGFDIIDCQAQGFKHAIPVPTAEELTNAYKHEYYSSEKPLYLERHREDLEWWNMVYAERYETLEAHLPQGRRRLLDVGSGPGFFLLHGKGRGWDVMGIEPSVQAFEHSQGLGLNVTNQFLSAENAASFGKFDAVNMSEVLEHIPDPESFLKLIHGMLAEDGLISIAVPNDFNSFQKAAVEQQALPTWWVAPPHHLNYFDHASLAQLVERCGYEVVYQEATFPIEMFLLMGDLYIGNDTLGRACHGRRKNFELNLQRSGMGSLKRQMYQKLAELGLGREVVIFARKK